MGMRAVALGAFILGLVGCVAAPVEPRATLAPPEPDFSKVTPVSTGAAQDSAAAVYTITANGGEAAAQTNYLFCADCRRTSDALAKENAELRAERDLLRQQSVGQDQTKRVLDDSFRFVGLPYVIRALHTLGKFDSQKKALARSGGIYRLIFENQYKGVVVTAARKWQCDYYESFTYDGACTKEQETGWLTYGEARAAICEAGYEGKNQLAEVVANWYASGIVYEKNLRFADWLTNKAIANLPGEIQKATAAVKEAKGEDDSVKIFETEHTVKDLQAAFSNLQSLRRDIHRAVDDRKAYYRRAIEYAPGGDLKSAAQIELEVNALVLRENAVRAEATDAFAKETICPRPDLTQE